jgi:hypothetical protein
VFASLNLLDHVHIVEALKATVPSTSTPTRISVKNAESITALIIADNATTVTGSAITLKQSTAVAGTGEKALAFTDYYSVSDTAAADAPWVRSTAVANTFTPPTTNSKSYIYAIPIDPASLDTNNSFDCVRVGAADATAQTITVLYLIVPKQGGNPKLFPSFIID